MARKLKRGKLKIYLFRHGQTTSNRDGKFTGQSEAKLTAKGRRHAGTVARKLKNKKFGVAFVTCLSRSRDTMKPVLKGHSECIGVIEDNRMIERSYGILQGTTHDQFIKKIGNQEYDLRIHGDVIFNTDSPKVIKWIKNFFGEQEYHAIHRGWNVKVPEGESFADVEKRVRSFIKSLKRFMKKNNVNVAISAHGNSIRLFRKVMENASIEEATKWFIPYDKVFEYSI